MSNNYDGSTKKWTRDCETCPYQGTETVLNKETKTNEIHPSCRWGVAIKILRPYGRPTRACEFRHRQPDPGSVFLGDRHLPPSKLRTRRRTMAREIQGSML
jgi:hypothetical protein